MDKDILVGGNISKTVLNYIIVCSSLGLCLGGGTTLTPGCSVCPEHSKGVAKGQKGLLNLLVPDGRYI